jgi:hypothetical protein
MQMVLQSYTNVYGYDTSSQQSTIPVNRWPFAEPITIHIEPLTAPSSSNLAMLAGLSHLYPGFKDVLETPGPFTTFKDALNGFRSAVIDAANGARASTGDLIDVGKMNDQFVANLLAKGRRPGTGGSSPSGGGGSGTGSGGTGPVASAALPVPTFPLHYVAEYALDTRVLTIRYIPRYKTYPTVSSKVGLMSELNPITPLTINPIKYMKFSFLHFDIAIPNGRTPDAVAEARANLAMDFIRNPRSLEAIVADVDPSVQGDKYYLMNDVLTPTGNVLKQKAGGPVQDPPTFKNWPEEMDPSMILDSVLADPQQGVTFGKTVNNQLQGGNPAPSPCVIVVWIDGVPYYVMIKNYN